MTAPKRSRGRPQTLPDPREFIPRLRAAGVPDAVIASAMGTSKQAVHARYGPRPDVPLLQVPPEARPAAKARQLAPAAFASRILKWRTGRGMTQAQAAGVAGVHPGTWARWETGALVPSAAPMILTFLATLDKES